MSFIKKIFSDAAQSVAFFIDGRTPAQKMWARISRKNPNAKRIAKFQAQGVVYDRGMNALHLAAQMGKTALVKELIARGADVNAVDDDNRTALIWATVMNKPETVKALVDNGADISQGLATGIIKLKTKQEIKDGAVQEKGLTAYQFAESHDYQQILQVLTAASKPAPRPSIPPQL